jgi:hypothetical protein
MLNFWRRRASKAILNQVVSTVFEQLEDRRLLSASWGHVGGGQHGRGGEFGGRADNTIAFSLAPSVVQTGLDSLATADGLTDPTSTTKVALGNANGVETYSVTLTGTGTVSKLTVDQLGDAVTAPTETTTTWATLSGTGTGSDSVAAAEITAIATAESLTAPASTDTVNLSTSSSGAVTYSIRLTSSSTTNTNSWGRNFGQTVTVDSSGNPVGNQQLPFSVIPTAIQTALNSHAPAGATALATTSTQIVDVQTTDGVITYSTTFTASGTQSTITVDIAGALTSLPSTTTTTFSALSTGVQTELQTLATADGVTTTISANQSINVLTETNGTIIYSAELGATGTGHNGSTYTFDVTVAVDSNGNPTTLPQGGNGFFGFGGPGFGPGGFQGTPGSDDGNNTNSSGGDTNSNSGTAVSIPSSSTSTASTVTGGFYTLSAKTLSAATNGLGLLGGYFLDFAPATVDAAVQADLTQIKTDQAKLASDTKSLTRTERSTLAADTRAINTAIKAISATLAPLEATLKADVKTWKTTLAKDEAAIKKDRKNATALAAAKVQLATDEASAFTAIAGDEGAIQTAIDSASGVVTAQAKLATDLPTIASDESAITAEQAQLVKDIESES